MYLAEKEQRASDATCEGEVVAEEEGGERALSLSLSSLGRTRELEGAAFVEFVAGLTREVFVKLLSPLMKKD